jgi:hypothetical protein
MRRPAIPFTAVTMLLLLVAGPAAAAKPDRFVADFQFADSIDCSVFNPAWQFRDDFVDFFHDRGQVWNDAAGNPLRGRAARSSRAEQGRRRDFCAAVAP